MKIGIIGATGKSGNFILEEAIERGHDVTAIVRNASKLTNKEVEVLEKDIYDLSFEDLKTFDVIVNAFGVAMGEEEPHVTAGRTLIEALKDTKARAIIIGGAGSLYIDENKSIKLFDTPDLPNKVKLTAKGQGQNLEELQQSEITWTYLSPSATFDPDGPRTGTYQKGKDHLLVNSEDESYLSYADCAIAVLDEIENPQHINERFTIVSESATE
ncbi:NAD(P)-dependent oxidoreductase [Metasolibacillus meyeri]|uniref:NAD(P)-dependent oxidoreductase n=1 Tax=Metasolibacillus meyeri TaxID=1071052 RepID=UPI000D30D992|nr:NAD(P)-dependent oxidoreductase [Metasolibacillus meyeri]